MSIRMIMLFTEFLGANLPMLQQLQSWLSRILILVQWLFGLAIAYVIANTGLILMGDGVATSEARLRRPHRSRQQHWPEHAAGALPYRSRPARFVWSIR